MFSLGFVPSLSAIILSASIPPSFPALRIERLKEEALSMNLLHLIFPIVSLLGFFYR